MSNIGKTVASTSAAHDAMIDKVRIIRDFMAGRDKVREQGQLYLARNPNEDSAAFGSRLQINSHLFNAVSKTVDDLTGMAFAKPIKLKDDVPQQLRDYAENIDLTGRHVNQFGRDVFREMIQPGVTFILVEMPRKVEGVSTVAQFKATGARPYLVHVKLEQFLGWKSEIVNGVERLTQARILESVTEPDGEWGEKEVKQVRVLTPGAWQLYR